MATYLQPLAAELELTNLSAKELLNQPLRPSKPTRQDCNRKTFQYNL